MKRTRRNESRIQLRSRGGAIVIGLLLVVAFVGTVSLGNADAYFELLGNMTAEALLRFPIAMYEVDQAEDPTKESFLADPRAFLERQDIYLPRDFRLVAVDLTEAANHNDEEATAVFFDEPGKGFTYQYAGIGLFYEKFGLMVALAVDLREERLAGTPRQLGGGDVVVRMYLQVLSSIPEVMLNRLSEIMGSVNEDDSGQLRLQFMADPRGYLLDRDLFLEKSEYRIVAFDFGVGDEDWYYHPSEEFPDWVPEGIGFCFENVALFMQQGLP